MGDDGGVGRSDRDAFVDADDGPTLEPEIVRWLAMYAEAADAHRDATAAAILDQVNGLLRRYRRESAVHRADYGSRLRTLTERMPVLLWTTDTGLRVTTVAGGGLAAVDIDPSSTASLPLAVALGTEAPSPGAVEAHKRALRGQPAVFEYDRQLRSYLAHVQPLADRDGATVGTIGLAIDITERKQAEEAARAAKQMLEHVLDSFPNGAIGVFDGDLRYVMATGRGLAEVGLAPEYMVGKTLADLYPPEMVAVMEGPHRRALAGETVTFDVSLGNRTYTLSVAPLDRVDGTVRTIVAVAQDITERVRAEGALARREAQLAEAQRLAHVGSWERDIATGRLTWSDELYRIYGMVPQEVPASFEAWMAHVHPDDAERVRAINEAAVRSGASFEYQARILRPDGEVRHYHSRGAVLRDASGRPSRVVGVVQDATERVRAEEARAARRERQARLDGMLFAIRELASRVTRDLAATSEARDVSAPGSSAPSSLDAALDAAAALSRALDDIAELRGQVPPE
jgi:PAS domain S-box-containing protein